MDWKALINSKYWGEADSQDLGGAITQNKCVFILLGFRHLNLIKSSFHTGRGKAEDVAKSRIK